MALERLRQQQVDHRRHDRAGLKAVLVDQIEERGGVEPAQQDRDRTLRRVHRGDRHEHPVGVRQRQRHQRSIQAAGVGHLLDRLARVVQVGVREHHALGPAGRSPRVQQGGEIVIVTGDDRGGLRVVEVGQGDHAVALAAVRTDHVPDRIETRHRVGDLVDELRSRDHRARFRVLDHVAKVLHPEQERGRCDHRARTPQSLVHDAHLGPVDHADHDPLARCDSELCKPAGNPARALEQLARAVPAALEKQRLVVAPALVRRLGQAGQIAICGYWAQSAGSA